jgi:outer membrane protein TolC
MEVTLVSRVKAVYYEIAFMDRAVAIMRETRDLLREFLDVSNTLYAVGQGLQADVLQAQVAVASLTEEITVVEQHRLATAARLGTGRGAPEHRRPAHAGRRAAPGAPRRP